MTSSSRTRRGGARSYAHTAGGDGDDTNRITTSSINALVSLAESCNTHQQYHDGLGPDHPDNQPIFEQVVDMERFPAPCRKGVLDELRKILPMVERLCTASAKALASDIQHLCDFYNNALEGVFCPHSPHVFDLGRDGTEIMPRVQFLFGHLLSKSIQTNAYVVENSEESSGRQRSVADAICYTIAHFLSWIPGSNVQRGLFEDLVDLSVDLAAVSDVVDASNVNSLFPLELAVFPNAKTAFNQHHLQDGDCVPLAIPNARSLTALRADLLELTRELLLQQRVAHLDADEDNMSECGEILPYYGNIHHEMGIKLLGVVRQVLVTGGMPTDMTSRRNDKKWLAHAGRLWRSALKMLSCWLRDFGCHAMLGKMHALQETALLAAQAVAFYLQEHWTAISTGLSDSSTPTFASVECAAILKTLLQETIWLPPSVGGCRDSSIAMAIRCCCLSPLMDALPSVAEIYSVNAQRMSKTGRELIVSVMATVYLSLRESRVTLGAAVRKKCVQACLLLLDYDYESESAFALLSQLLFHINCDPALQSSFADLVTATARDGVPSGPKHKRRKLDSGRGTATIECGNGSMFDVVLLSEFVNGAMDESVEVLMESHHTAVMTRVLRRLLYGIAIVCRMTELGRLQRRAPSDALMTEVLNSMVQSASQLLQAFSNKSRLDSSVVDFALVYLAKVEPLLSSDDFAAKMRAFEARCRQQCLAQARESFKSAYDICCSRSSLAYFDCVAANASVCRCSEIRRPYPFCGSVTAHFLFDVAFKTAAETIDDVVAWLHVAKDQAVNSSYLWRIFRVESQKITEGSETLTGLLLWQLGAWLLRNMSDIPLGRGGNVSLSEGGRSDSLFGFLFSTAFTRTCSVVRHYTCSELGSVRLIEAALQTVFQTTSPIKTPRSAGGLHPVVQSIFDDVDQCLFQLGQVDEKQIPKTHSNLPRRDMQRVSIPGSLEQRATLRFSFAALRSGKLDSELASSLFNGFITRTLRLVVVSDGCTEYSHATAQMIRFALFCGHSIRGRNFDGVLFGRTILQNLFALVDLDSHSDSMRSTLEGLAFIGPILMGLSGHDKVLDWCPTSVTVESLDGILPVVDDILPHVLSDCVLHKNEDDLLILAVLAEILSKHGKQIETSFMRNEHKDAAWQVDMSRSIFDAFRIAAHAERQRSKLLVRWFLEPGIVNRSLPLIFARGDKEEFLFYKNHISQGVAFKELIESRGVVLLKELALLLGSDLDDPCAALRAIRITAVLSHLDSDAAIDASSGAVLAHRGDTAPEKVMISQNFMYLIVNVVQVPWKSSTSNERLHRLVAISRLLDMVDPHDSSLFMPQMISIVTTAIACSELLENGQDPAVGRHMKAVAVDMLSKFLRMVAIKHVDVLKNNLPILVVSLIPVLSPRLQNCSNGEDAAAASSVQLLQWLTSGDLGRELAPSFDEIPFLPSIPALDSTRRALRALGVEIDDIAIPTAAPAHSEDASQVGSLSVDQKNPHVGRRQDAIRRRLKCASRFLSSENVSIRRVVLEYISAMLHGNRSCFYALVDNETVASMKQFITVSKEGDAFPVGVVTEMTENLLSRCAQETDSECRKSLAICLGEIGAISPRLLERNLSVRGLVYHGFASMQWMVGQAPWRSHPAEYMKQLVTHELVVALNASETATEQHKVAFAIQELLKMVDKTASGSVGAKKLVTELTAQLRDAGVYEVIEPFWSSEFEVIEPDTVREGPFFDRSSDYLSWSFKWSSFLIKRISGPSEVGSTLSEQESPWHALFKACRTVVRTTAGINVTEFLLPILILDRITFGDTKDYKGVLLEIQSVLKSGSERLSRAEKQKAVAGIFKILDTLQLYSYTETERRHDPLGRRTKPSKESDPRQGTVTWPMDQSIMRIDELLLEIPYVVRAEAAASVGMYARALQCLEFASRSAIAEAVFDKLDHDLRGGGVRSIASGDCVGPERELLKDMFSELNDFETVRALDLAYDEMSTPASRARNSIRLREASGDWDGALHDYEKSLRSMYDPSTNLHSGMLSCMLHLGHFESVLSQYDGLSSDQSIDARIRPLAAEAAWRLSDWKRLDTLLAGVEVTASTVGAFELCKGRIMQDLHRRDYESFKVDILQAREAVMETLSVEATQSYPRAYKELSKLHVLREIDDVATILCQKRQGSGVREFREVHVELCWDQRLEIMSYVGATSAMQTRLVLCAIAEDYASEFNLHLKMGKMARKALRSDVAGKCFAEAEATQRVLGQIELTDESRSQLKLQMAKLRHDDGKSSSALRILWPHTGSLDVTRIVDGTKPRSEGTARVDLQATLWMIEGGLKGSNEILDRFRQIEISAPNFERGHFQYAKYVDALLRTRSVSLSSKAVKYSGMSDAADDGSGSVPTVAYDVASQKYTVRAIKHYFEALSLCNKHVYQALPRFLSLWFDFVSVALEGSALREALKKSHPDAMGRLCENQKHINEFLAANYRHISAAALYTALPQLISRLLHEDSDTRLLVHGMLRRTLIKHPLEAMWPLAWLRNSKKEERRHAADEIFAGAEIHHRQLADKNGDRTRIHSILADSGSLFTYFRKLAELKVDDHTQSVKIVPWRGNVSLADFVPPVKAALTPLLAPKSEAKDPFPREVPRIRCFAKNVSVMHSKARPRRVKSYVITHDAYIKASRNGSQIAGSASCAEHDKDDIGEMHFLLKREDKGDLRKDARVQDLNNVVNRLMLSNKHEQKRQMQLRTFAVTCISENIGLLEWVPNTMALRSLITRSCNPQASPFSPRRRGHRAANFADPELKKIYEETCQDMYFKRGELKRAGELFEKCCLRPYPPLLYWWFVQAFQDPHTWYVARTQFSVSAAAWSAVGHVIGLGDRHSENILVDTLSGECVHVDFDCIFDKALMLPRPEIVPFRLTSNMVDAFGPTGAEGVYSTGLHDALATLRDNRDTLLSVLEPFVKDPVIDWKRYRHQQRKDIPTQERQAMEVRRTMQIIDERLQGMYNLRNPNLAKYRRDDSTTIDDEEEMSHLVPLSVEGQAHKLIAEATSSENLVQMFTGWMPWL